MALRVAIQMDPLEGVNIDGDTTFALAEAAQARGHRLWVYSPSALVYENGSVFNRPWEKLPCFPAQGRYQASNCVKGGLVSVKLAGRWTRRPRS